MEFSEIYIDEIQNLNLDASSAIRGTVSFQFKDKIGDVSVGHIISVKMRISYEADATFPNLEKKLFEEAARLLTHAAQLAEKESLESLRQRATDRKRETASAHQREMATIAEGLTR